MSTNPFEPPKEVLCDTCRQNVAVRHFWVDDVLFAGKLVQRHLCVTCPYPISNWQLHELTMLILETGNFELCGGKPFSFGGVPGVSYPQREILCQACALPNQT